MSVPTPSQPKMEGNAETIHDNMNDADHEKQLHGNDQKDSAEGEDRGHEKEDNDAEEKRDNAEGNEDEDNG